MEPTPIQRNIIKEEGNTVVLAMPGSGKTFVLSEKIRRILESDVLKDYQGVIAISYTRKASGHLKRKTLQNGTWVIVSVNRYHRITRIGTKKIINNSVLYPNTNFIS